MSSESLFEPGFTDAKAPAIPLAIYALTISTCAMGTEGYVYLGHLESLAKDMGKDLSQMGQIATAFAITYALGLCELSNSGQFDSVDTNFETRTRNV